MSDKALKKIRLPLLAVIIGGGFALRFNLAVKAFFSTFDTSTVGVMALRILHESERPLFYYGQDYMGALEAYMAAFFFALFGPTTTVLSLAPTLYALGWVLAMYLLFAEIFGVAGGLAAALSAAACGWYSLWFTMASYGGYPETLLFGTLFLWLVVRITFREASPFFPAAAAGVVAALGIWTNYQVISYLATGGLAAVVAMTDRARRRRLFLPFVVTALIALTGFGPLVVERLGPFHGTDQYAGQASLDVATNVSMFAVAMKRHFSWPVEVAAGFRQAALLSFAAALVLSLKTLPGKIGEKREALVPLLFLLVFPILFLLHPKAATGATRYTIPLMSMAVALFFAGAVSARRQALKVVGWLSVLVWTAFNVLSAAATAEAKREDAAAIRGSRNDIAAVAGELGLRHVEIIGSEIDGLNGQSLTFFSQDRVRFTAILNERHLPSAEDADRDDRSGLFCKKEHFGKVAHSLQAAGVSFRHRTVAGRVILYDIAPLHRVVRSVPAAEMKVRITAAASGDDSLTDRIENTAIDFPSGEHAEEFEIEVTFPRSLIVSGLRLHSPYPTWATGSFHVSGSVDGNEFTPLAPELKQPLPLSRGGNTVLVMRLRNPMELFFPPREVRHLRIRIRPEQSRGRIWRLSEIFILEDLKDGRAVTEEEVAAIGRSLQEKNVDFCAADPWLSARLQKRPDGPAVYRRYNERYQITRRDRDLRLRDGLAIVVDEALAGEAALILAAALPQGLVLDEDRHEHYRIFTFSGKIAAKADPGPALTWNEGMVLIKDSSSVPGGKK